MSKAIELAALCTEAVHRKEYTSASIRVTSVTQNLWRRVTRSEELHARERAHTERSEVDGDCKSDITESKKGGRCASKERGDPHIERS